MEDVVASSDQAPVGAAELFREHAPFVGRLLGRLGVPRRDLDDAVQDVFLTAHRRGGFIPDRAKARTWLGEISIRVAANIRRARRRHPTDLDDVALGAVPTPGADPYEAAALAEQIERVAVALESVPVAQRIVFVLFELEGEPAESIARGLGVPLGTVHSRLHVARRAFRSAYEAITAVSARSRPAIASFDRAPVKVAT